MKPSSLQRLFMKTEWGQGSETMIGIRALNYNMSDVRQK